MLAGCNETSSSRYIYDYFFRYFFTWFHGLMLSSGIIGSCLCFIVILRYRVFTNSTRYWFLALTLSDILMLALCGSDLYVLKLFEDKYVYILDISGIVGCELRMSIIVALSWTSNFLQTGLSIERMISILSPFKARILFTVKRTRICLISLVFVCVTSSFIINFLTIKYTPDNSLKSGGTCGQVNITDLFVDPSKVFYKLDLFVFRVLPYTIMFVSSLLITGFVRQNRSTRKNLMQVNIHSQATEKNREFRMSVLLLAMNFTTLVTNPLFTFFELLDGAGTEGKAYGKLTGDHCLSKTLTLLFNSLLYFNNATNWCFYVAVGARFRKYFILLLRNCFFCNTASRTSSNRDNNSTIDDNSKLTPNNRCHHRSNNNPGPQGELKRDSNCAGSQLLHPESIETCL